jgi:LysM repeat protein
LLSASRSTVVLSPVLGQDTAARQAGTAKLASASGTKYTVKSGDTLSSIAGRFYQSTAYWPAIYWANHSKIRYANNIEVGQVLTIPAKPATIPNAPSAVAPAPAPAPAETAQTTSTQAAPTEAAPAESADTSTGGDSSFQQCVINRESGGNSQAEGAGGYYGLYQFSASTWAEYGGNPADYGNATAAEQNQVFDNAVASGGESNWSSYDGC